MVPWLPPTGVSTRSTGADSPSCVGEIDGLPVSDGDGLPTGTLGTKQLIVTATDNVGNTSSATVSYEVVEASLALTPTTAVVGTNISQAFTVEGFDAVGNSLGDDGGGGLHDQPERELHPQRLPLGHDRLEDGDSPSRHDNGDGDARRPGSSDHLVPDHRWQDDAPVAGRRECNGHVGLPVTFTTTTPAVCVAGGLNGSAITLIGPRDVHRAGRSGRRRHLGTGGVGASELHCEAGGSDDHLSVADRKADHRVAGCRECDCVVGAASDVHDHDPDGVHGRRHHDHAARCRQVHGARRAAW